MITKLRRAPKERYWEYFILVARFLLSITFLSYGYSKLIEDGQFGISPSEMATPIKDLSLFRVMRYLFDHEPIKTAIGVLQIITGVLLLFNKTAILGVMFFIPIAANILLMDISFMPESLAMGFAKRFTFYFFLCFLILWNDRERIKVMWDAIIKKLSFRLRFPIILYLMVPVFALMLEFSPAILQVIYGLITEPEQTFETVRKTFLVLVDVFKRI